MASWNTYIAVSPTSKFLSIAATSATGPFRSKTSNVSNWRRNQICCFENHLTTKHGLLQIIKKTEGFWSFNSRILHGCVTTNASQIWNSNLPYVAEQMKQRKRYRFTNFFPAKKMQPLWTISLLTRLVQTHVSLIQTPAMAATPIWLNMARQGTGVSKWWPWN